MLHGALGAKSQFSSFQNYIKDEFEGHAFSFSGHGGEPFNSSFSIQQFAKETLDFITKHKLDHCYVFGYSMGGYVALYLEKNYPGTFQSIFTLATKFNWTKESAEKEVKLLNPEVIEQKVPDFAQELAARHGVETWKKLMQHTSQMMLDMGENPPLSYPELATINCKTWISLGSADRMVSIAESEAAANHLPQAIFKLFDDWPHPFEKVDLELLAREIKSFCLE